MWLVVDSGSTKADWAMVDQGGKRTHTTTMGFNPYFHTPERISQELTKEEFSSVIPLNEIKHVYYYGAGCPDEKYRLIIRAGLERVFPQAKIEVEHDLLGAARATCGKMPGIAGILGTGSNSCAYDGENVIDNVTALSHVLGDEGSGVHLGKLLLQAYYYRELPHDLEDEFNRTYPEGKDSIIHRIYEAEGQNVKIAEFAQFVIKHKKNPFIKKLIHQSFGEYARRHLKKYENWQNLKINLVGSIGDLLREDLHEVFVNEGLTLGVVIRRPIESLIDYHTRL
ncbi:MAG TPA: hypothetical protein VNJ08_01110 [Bacteriovoracaceae bacterium]|nr:hypothetical protein [Bacteriovoracaceae bacterium]